MILLRLLRDYSLLRAEIFVLPIYSKFELSLPGQKNPIFGFLLGSEHVIPKKLSLLILIQGFIGLHIVLRCCPRL